MGVRVTVKDKGFKVLQKHLKELGGLSLTVGIQGADGLENYPLEHVRPRLGFDPRGRRKVPINVATVAAIHEMGMGDVPTRPFLRHTFETKRKRIAQSLGTQISLMIQGKKTPVEALEGSGRLIAGLVDQTLRQTRTWAAPNKERTVAIKGFQFPLRDTGRLQRKVTYAVRLQSGSILVQGRGTGAIG